MSTPSAYAQDGCCSYHGGVRADGCGCNDGTSLSKTCIPYYTCTTQQQTPTLTSPGTNVIIQTNPMSSPVPSTVSSSFYTVTRSEQPLVPPTRVSTPTPRVAKHISFSILPKINFFTWFLSLFRGLLHFTPPLSPTTPVTNNAGISLPNSICHAKQINASDPQAYLPDANCTPGVINTAVTQENIFTTICISGYTKTIRPPVSYTNNLKRQQIHAYGYIDTNPSDYEEDHLLSLELGGSPSDPKNLWPEPHASLNEKDRVENYLHKQVCDGQLPLVQAQSKIIQNWYAVYQEIK